MNRTMKKISTSCSLIALMMSYSVTADTKEALNEFCKREDFASNISVADSELAEMRGGFVFANGLKVDFGLAIRSMVDGIILREVAFNSDRLTNIDNDTLQTIIQVNNEVNNAGGFNVKVNNIDVKLPDSNQIVSDVNGKVSAALASKGIGNNNVNKNDGIQAGNINIEPTVIDVTKGNNISSQVQEAVTQQIQSPVTNAQADLAGQIPGLVTIIQNSVDNRIIQNYNIVDVEVSGLASLRMQNINNLINHQAILGLRFQ